MTPNYASPEQVSGDAVTLLSDIYSLGAVLYELLTGKSPRRFEKLTPQTIAQALCDPIALPSAAVEDQAAARQLAGDLDNILMRALETEPERRYESAAQFADDVRRYLHHEPVRARPQTIRYRALKFVRRNRVTIAAAAAVLIALTGGLAVSVYQARIADTRLQQIRSLSDKLVFDVHDAVRELPGATRARQVIIQTGVEYLDSSVNSVKGDPSAQKALAKAFRRLGEVQGNVRAPNLGDPSSALASYRKALALLDDATRRAPVDVDAMTERLVLYNRIGAIESYTGKLRDALHTLQVGIQTGTPFSSLAGADIRVALADLYVGASEARRNMDDHQGALQDALESARLYREAAAIRPSDLTLTNGLSDAYASVGMAESGLNRLQDALAHFRLGTAEMEKLVASDPRNVSWRRDLMLKYGHIADVLGNPGMLNLGDRAGALEAYQRAAAIGKTLYEEDRADHRAAADYGIVLSRVETTMDDRDLPAKLAVQRQSLRVLEDAATVSPGNVSLQIYLALIHQHLGDSLRAGADLEAAHQAYAKAATIAESNIKSGHTALFTMFIQANQRLALNAVARTRREDALDFARRALHAAQNPPQGAARVATAVPRGLSAMGLTYAALLESPLAAAGDLQEAVRWLRQGLDAWRAAQSAPGFGSPQRREMREVEETLARLERHK